MTRWLAPLVVLTGCAGSIGEAMDGEPVPPGASPMDLPGSPGAGSAGPAAPGGVPGAGGSTPGSTTPPAAACQGVEPGPAPLRRLTRFEYNNTVRDLLGDTTNPGDALPPEELGNGFGNDADSLGVSRLLVDQHFEVSKGIALRATADARKLAALLGCSPPATAEEACIRSFVTSFGARAFRRPVEASDADALVALFRTVRAGGAFEVAARAVLQAILQSPRFLYRVEFGAPAPAGAAHTRPDPWEMASRLSYLLWGTMPDADLLNAARDGRLGTAAEVRAQAERMLKDPKARAVVRFFHDVLFRLDGAESLQKNPASYPGFAGMAPLLKEETERFLDHVVWDGPGDLASLLSASYSFMNAKVAKYYGVAGPTSDRFERVNLDPNQRSGLLTQGILLSLLTPGLYTNPTIRGVFVLERLLCSPPPDPPSTLNVQEPKYTPDQTTRERFAAHAKDDACKGCHRLMDPLGFGLENYDGAGLWRAKDNGKPIDASGEIVIDVDIKGPFNGPIELTRKLAKSDRVRQCMVSHWFSFAYGRAETERDRCAKASLQAAFAQSGFKVRDLLVALTQTDAFLYRPTTVR